MFSPLEIWLRNTAPDVWARFDEYRRNRKAEMAATPAVPGQPGQAAQPAVPAQAPATPEVLAVAPQPQPRTAPLSYQAPADPAQQRTGPIQYNTAEAQKQNDPNFRRYMFERAQMRPQVNDAAQPPTTRRTGQAVPPSPRSSFGGF